MPAIASRCHYPMNNTLFYYCCPDVLLISHYYGIDTILNGGKGHRSESQSDLVKVVKPKRGGAFVSLRRW